MNALRVKKEGHGKNVRTCILNITTVAEQLNIPHSPQFISKYLALELGSRDTWDKNRKIATIKGVHSQQTLQEKLHGFLDLFILCPNCWAPELRHKWKKRGAVIARCVACGWEGRSIRSGHRVGKFILRNPPPKGRTAKRPDPNGNDIVIEATRKVPPVKENWDAWTLATKCPPEESLPPREESLQNVACGPPTTATGPVGSNQRTPKTTEQWWEDMHKVDRELQPKTPLGLFRVVLAEADCRLVDAVSEFLRLEAAHKLDQLAVTKLVVDACLDFRENEDTGTTPLQALSQSVQKNHLFLNWFTSQARVDRMRSDCDFMLMSYIENELLNRGMLKDVPLVLELLYDNYVFDAAFFVAWSDKKASYVVRDQTDMDLVRSAGAPFVEWARSQMEETAV